MNGSTAMMTLMPSATLPEYLWRSWLSCRRHRQGRDSQGRRQLQSGAGEAPPRRGADQCHRTGVLQPIAATVPGRLTKRDLLVVAEQLLPLLDEKRLEMIGRKPARFLRAAAQPTKWIPMPSPSRSSRSSPLRIKRSPRRTNQSRQRRPSRTPLNSCPLSGSAVGQVRFFRAARPPTLDDALTARALLF